MLYLMMVTIIFDGYPDKPTTKDMMHASEKLPQALL